MSKGRIIKLFLLGKWPNYNCNFRIHQEMTGIGLIKNMQDKLGNGKVHILKHGMCNLSVLELTDIIIPFSLNTN